MAATLDDRAMQYLSVHDIVWINTMVAGQALTFDYATLEEAMAAQYSYGVSTYVPVQAANLLKTLALKRPFEFGNIRTGFIALTTYLNANGFALTVDDATAAEIVRGVAEGRLAAADAIAQLAAPAAIGMRPGVTLRGVVTHIFNTHTDAVQRLARGDE